MKLIVVGGGGFIGRNFVRAAAGCGHEVFVVARSTVPELVGAAGVSVMPEGLDGLVGEPDLLAQADAICHFASTTIPGTSNADPEVDVRENLVPSVRLLEAMRRTGTRRILFLSTGGAIYGRPLYSPIDEDHPQLPISSYGVVKGAIERYLEMYRDLYGFRPITIRPANPFGPGQSAVRQVGIISALLSAARENREATIYGDGSIVRDFIYIDDLCALLLRALETDAVGIYNCGSGTGVSLNKVADVVDAVTGRMLARRYLPARAFDPAAIVLDIEHARRDLGWKPQFTLIEGVQRTWNWISEQPRD